MLCELGVTENEVHFFCLAVQSTRTYEEIRDVLFTETLISFNWITIKNLTCVSGRGPFFLAHF